MKTYLWMSSAAVVIGALRFKLKFVKCQILTMTIHLIQRLNISEAVSTNMIIYIQWRFLEYISTPNTPDFLGFKVLYFVISLYTVNSWVQLFKASLA